VARNPVMLAHTILRRILFTGGSGVLSTTAPAGWVTVFDAAGSGGLAAVGSRAGTPAATVSPGCAVVWFAADSS
jgi:hypothetical protein